MYFVFLSLAIGVVLLIGTAGVLFVKFLGWMFVSQHETDHGYSGDQ
jgi:hypothetical protein